MDFSPPTLDDATDDAPPPPFAPSGQQRHAGRGRDRDRVIAGVCGLLAERLGIDALWLRIGFVVTGLVSGVGVVLYVALWLALVRGQRSTVPRWIGGLLLLAVIPFAMSWSDRRGFATGPIAVVALLAGLTLALWQPRRDHAWAAPLPPPVPGSSDAPSDPAERAARARLAQLAKRPVRPPREPSLLGRAFLGLAVIAAAVGALIDQANGGRLHPEQWLGAAAMLSGAGLLLGTFRGRGRWLILPAAAFAAIGYVGGEAARIGIELDGLSDDMSVYVQKGQPGFTRTASAIKDDAYVQIDGAPTGPAAINLTSVFGDLTIYYTSDVPIEVRATVDHGDVIAYEQSPEGFYGYGSNGVKLDARRPIRRGDGDPIIVITARLGHGDIRLRRNDPPPASEPPPSLGNIGVDDATLFEVQPGLRMAADGTLVFGNGQFIVDPDGMVLANSAAYTSTESGDTVLSPNVGERIDDALARTSLGFLPVQTDFGEWRILPRNLLLTPEGRIVDLTKIRATVAGRTTPAPSTGPVDSTASRGTGPEASIDPVDPAVTDGTAPEPSTDPVDSTVVTGG